MDINHIESHRKFVLYVLHHRFARDQKQLLCLHIVTKRDAAIELHTLSGLMVLIDDVDNLCYNRHRIMYIHCPSPILRPRSIMRSNTGCIVKSLCLLFSNHNLKNHKVTSGDPQESHLGRLLFHLFVNDDSDKKYARCRLSIKTHIYNCFFLSVNVIGNFLYQLIYSMFLFLIRNINIRICLSVPSQKRSDKLITESNHNSYTAILSITIYLYAMRLGKALYNHRKSVPFGYSS